MSAKIGIVGATGAVGVEMIGVIGELGLVADPQQNLRLFASARSKGKQLPFVNKCKETTLLTVDEFHLENPGLQDLQVLLLASTGDFARENVPKLVEKFPSLVIIDNSSAFRYDDKVPLVVPELNYASCEGKNVIANPNCTTAILAMALHPIHKKYTVKRCIVSTYQAASGAGAEGMGELETSLKEYPEKTMEWKAFRHPLLSNVIPHIDSFQDNGYTKEEMKVAWETRKIFTDNMHDTSIKVSCTAVRIPTLRAHAEAVTLELAEDFTSKEEIQQLLRESPGVDVVDSPSEAQYPMPMNASGKHNVEVGRIRRNDIFDFGLDFFVCGDQLLRGAALNAVLIAQRKLGL